MGVSGVVGESIIVIAAIGDILLGLLLWYKSIRKWIIYMQIAVMLIYSIIITLFVPLLWLHPFAPIIKNLAMLVQSFYLLAQDGEIL